MSKGTVAAALALCMTALLGADPQRMQPRAGVLSQQRHCDDAAVSLHACLFVWTPMCQLNVHATQACGQPSASSSRLTDFYELDINIRGFPSLAASLVSCSKICMQS
jgi:hypothetical protein